MLMLFRRHRKSCPHSSRGYRRCRCPLHVEGSLGGESIRKALDLTSWEAATDLIAEWNRAGRIGGRVVRSVPVHEAITAYLAYCGARKLSPRSVARYRAFLERSLLPWCDAHDVRLVKEFTFKEASAFYASWTTWSSYTAAKNLELLRMFLRYCRKARWVEENVADDLDAPRVTMAPTLPFTDEEVERILAACDSFRTNGRQGRNTPHRARAFILTLRYTGLRIGDVATLETKRLVGSAIQVRTAKTGQEVCVPIPEFVAAALLEQAAVNANPDYFFWSGESTVKCATAMWQRTIKTACTKAGVPDGHAHRFRDTFATSLLVKGVSIEVVATLLGHANIQVTQKHYNPWVKARQEALELAVRSTWEEEPRLRLVKESL